MVDVVMIGGGLIGSVLALALSEAHFTVALLEKTPSVECTTERVTAVYWAGCQILKNLGVWDNISVDALAPLRRLVVWDGRSMAELEWDSAELGLAEWGWIIENQSIMSVLRKKLAASAGVTLYDGIEPIAVDWRDSEGQTVHITLPDRETITASVLVGADGKNSWVRRQCGMALQEYSYEQEALTTRIHVEKPHQHTGWQVFLGTGPLAILPLANAHQCAVVWSSTARGGVQCAAELEPKLNAAFGTRLGHITVMRDAQVFPLSMHHAKNYIHERVALVGDAAHAIHPLAGLGANLGLLDTASLIDCLSLARSQGGDIGSHKTLRRYERWRKSQNQAVIHSMRGLHELFLPSHPSLTQARAWGLQRLNGLTCVKNKIMKAAIGYQAEDLPSLAKRRV